MPTLRSAADLLRAANTFDGRVELARSLGFDGELLGLDGKARQRLNLSDDISDAALIEGQGCLRALLVDAPYATSMRSVLATLATSLDSRSSQLLWLVIATAGDDVGLATWQPGTRGARVAALVARRDRIVASDGETVLALLASTEGADLVVHTRWSELLGREAVSRRFFRVLERCVRQLAGSLTSIPPDDAHTLALLCASRLLFLSFLETKGWLNGDHGFLARTFDKCMASGGRFHARVLLPLYFGTLNTRPSARAAAARQLGAIPFLNGGLFARTALEKRHRSARFSDAAFGTLFRDLFGAFRFTARESDDLWMEASIDPEMLGRAFESLIAASDRRTSGAFYTPQTLVEHVTMQALVIALASDEVPETRVRALLTGQLPGEREAQLLKTRLAQFTVLDPACGSGAFLVHVLERLADLYRLVGDTRDLATIRRDVLGRSIHGVDVNPTAVWLCELRLWLSVVIESRETRMSAVPPLPNLDCNVRVGDTLSGSAFREDATVVGPPAVLARLHARYVRATGPRKASLRKSLQREERKRALAAIDRDIAALANQRRERIRARRAADLFGLRSRPGAADRAEMRASRRKAVALRRERRRIEDGGALAFSFPSHFGAAHARGGFDLIIGNPPWVRLHNIPLASRAALRDRFRVYRDASWVPEHTGLRSSAGFSSQVDMASLFVERSGALATRGGCIALLLPVKLWQSLSGGGTRRFLDEQLCIRAVEDWSSAPCAFDAAVYPSVLIATRVRQAKTPVVVSVRTRALTVQWTDRAQGVRLFPGDAGSPFLLLPPQPRNAFDKIVSRGVPLAESALGQPVLGVKCGLNDAFLVETVDEHGNEVCIEAAGRRGAIERDVLRPLLRGESVTSWAVRRSRSSIVWTHDEPGAPRATLPAGVAQWLAPWQRQLAQRTDLHSARTWWMLFRTEGADSSLSRVVWSDFARRPRAALLARGDATVPLNTCYVVRCEDHLDALALCALLNTPLAAAWLNAVAESARGNWHRYLAWTVSLLPVPHDWIRARNILAPYCERALMGDIPTDPELFAAACHAYRVRPGDIEPLLEWSHLPSSS